MPCFLDSVTDINLSNNNFSSIKAYQRLPERLKKLDLSSCNIHEIEEGFVRQFSHLEYLDISYNRELTINVLPNITYDLQFTSIKVLRFEAIQCRFGKGLTIKREHIYYLRNTTLKDIDFSSNRIESIEQFVVSNLPSTLMKVTASNNWFKFGWYLLEMLSLVSLKTVNISNLHNLLDSYWTFFEATGCNDSTEASQNSIHPFNLSLPGEDRKNRLLNTSCLQEYHSPPPFITASLLKLKVYLCLPQALDTLIISHNLYDRSETFSRDIMFDYTSIKTLDESGKQMERLEFKVFTGNLTNANYSNNYLNFIEPRIFQRANLTVLDLSSNYLGNQIRGSNSSEILLGQIYLRYLNLSRNRIQHIMFNFFKSLLRLQNLDLSENELDEVEFDIRTLTEMKSLNLRNNYIKSFSENIMDSINKINKGQLRIDLSDNDILCSCATINFLKWMESNRDMFIDIERYICSFSNSTRANFSDIHYLVKYLEKQCSSYAGVIAGTVTVVTASLITMTVAILYRFRWRVRYFYYMAKRSYRGKAISHQQLRNNFTSLYKYCAFISYSDDDRKIALHGMKTNVEDEFNGLKLCFHQRDFLPGFSIAENIANAIHESRKVVCFVSDSFLNSEWCMYEFNMALMENIHDHKEENMLFLVLLSGFDAQKAPLSMLEFIRNNSYIEYPDDELYEPMFWTKVSEAISC